MNRVRNVRVGWPRPLRVLTVTAALAGFAGGTAAPAVAQVSAALAAETGRLTLENARPLPVPPAPRIQTPKSVKAPPQFVAPQPIEPPPLPGLVPPPAVAQPTPPAGAPPVQTAARPAPVPAPAETPAAVASPPKPAPATQSPPAQSPSTQTTALPPPAAPAAPRTALSVVFEGAAPDVPDSAEATVNDLAERMRANESLRLQLRSYASGTPETAREARQLSLARALALRERLTAFGIRSTRIDIRALGTGAADGPPDRIDVEFLN